MEQSNTTMLQQHSSFTLFHDTTQSHNITLQQIYIVLQKPDKATNPQSTSEKKMVSKYYGTVRVRVIGPDSGSLITLLKAHVQMFHPVVMHHGTSRSEF